MIRGIFNEGDKIPVIVDQYHPDRDELAVFIETLDQDGADFANSVLATMFSYVFEEVGEDTARRIVRRMRAAHGRHDLAITEADDP